MHAPLPTPGSLVWIRRRRWRVESARRDHSVVRLDVADRERRLTFLAPFDRPSVVEATQRPRHAHVREAAARLAGLVARAPSARGLPTALDATVDILPYQLEPALAVVAGVRRVLIADEVGLGKTIQAALAIAELKRRRPSLRAIVIAPRSLRDQWRQELQERFGLDAMVGDREGLESAGRSVGYGRNPWTSSGIWVVSADYLKQPHVVDAIPPIPWDIVVIDEAHDACGDSARHEASDEMARRSRHVILLTATPHVGDATRFQRLENLGRLSGIDDPLTTFRRSRTSLGQLSTRRVRWPTVLLTPSERATLDALATFERAVLSATPDRQRDGAVLLLSIFRKRALSTMSALHVSLERRLGWILGRSDDLIDWIQPRLQLEDPDDGRADDDCAALTADTGLPVAVERTWLRRVRELAATALRHDSKIRRVVRLLDRTSEPVVVFTEFRHSLDALREGIESALAGRRHVGVLHGGQSAAERAATIGQFRSGRVSVLLATDVASQGLNLQDCARWIVSLELPWTPARIEQRIGRVDRIGQMRPVHATLLVAGHPSENGLLSRLAARVLNVRRVVGGDALAGITPPSERGVAESIIAGSAAADPEWSDGPPTLATTACWQRQARAVGRQLMWKRTLVQRWRAADQTSVRPRLAISQRPASGLTAVVIVSVPIVDGTGFLSETKLVCLDLGSARISPGLRLIRSDAMREWLTGHLAPRLARLRRNAAALAATAARVDQAIVDNLTSAGWPVEVQVGLFERRAERAFLAARDDVTRVAKEVRAHGRNWQAAGELEVGWPSVALIFAWPRCPRS